MASVCSSSLSLMDAGVPIKAPVAGIAMGLVFAEGKYTTLTDILGAEDAFGDMDFKVAGTADFVTALQLDTKIDGLPADVLGAALQQARQARLAILEVMHSAIAEPRQSVADTAPKIVSLEIPLDKGIERVEAVVDLGDEIEVRADDIDPQGKVSLSLAGDETAAPARTPSGNGAERVAAPVPDTESADDVVSFEDNWEAVAKAEFGD